VSAVLRRIARDWLPPAISRRLRRWSGTAGSSDWEVIPGGFAAARSRPEIRGWNVPTIAQANASQLPALQERYASNGPLAGEAESLSNTQDIIQHNIRMSFAYVLALASRRGDAMSMLDWGGGLGQYSALSRALIPSLKLEYHCKDVPALAEQGRAMFPESRFYSDESCLQRSYELVFAGCSLHYSEDWRRTLAGLAGSARRYLYIAELPVVQHAPAFVYVQRPYGFGYGTEYVSWCLNRAEFLDESRKIGLTLQREFLMGHQPAIKGAPEQCEYRGFLFRPGASGDIDP